MKMLHFIEDMKTPPPNGKRNPTPGKNGFHKQHSLLEEQHSLLEEQELIEKLEKNPRDLSSVSSYVQKNKGKELKLLKDPGLSLRICDLNGTNYMGQGYMLESWKNIYLPKKTEMVVLGAVDNCLCLAPGLQLVILVAEDGCIYAYEDEELHELAKSLKEFAQNGIKEPYKVYEYPPDISDEDEETLETDPEILEIRRRTKAFVDESAEDFEELLSMF